MNLSNKHRLETITLENNLKNNGFKFQINLQQISILN